ncbi:hypothetical protein HYH03_018480 [Edaphochlamys debaryana]|uniref:F-box domain-containing protein n=1 Tax=Edaphochlamys debaryana TaxID=47281 RepID=A0A835XF69_9CHLO|nr:hypothetical protein HYH03_018480 [Edaphochlamys debaryana]|eukprot:KAG2482596.1 hypothetical protein HYH03_018480 [Edaphochlamys debaryana]
MARSGALMMATTLLHNSGRLAGISLSRDQSTELSSGSFALRGIESLTDDVLLHIFRLLDADVNFTSPQNAARHFIVFRRCLPLVCRRWAALLGPGSRGGKWPWNYVVVSVEAEASRRRRPPDPSQFMRALGSPSSGAGGGAGALSGTSPPGGSMVGFMRPPALGPPATLRSASVLTWTEARSGSIQHLVLDFSSACHDFSGGHALEALLRAANRGRGLQTLRLHGSAVPGGQDSHEVLGRLKGLQELHVSGLPQGFLAGTLPYLSSLTGLTRLEFTPEAFQFPVSVPTLPSNLRVLALSQLWLSRLPPVPSVAPGLRELSLTSCCLVEGVLAALGGCSGLEALALSGSSLTTAAGGRMGWEASRQWPRCPGLRRLELVGCSLHEVPAGALAAFPGLTYLDVSNNPELGGAASAPDPGSASALPSEVLGLPQLADVRMAGCGLTALPPMLLRLPAITALDLSSNSLSALPLPLPPSAPACAPPPSPGVRAPYRNGGLGLGLGLPAPAMSRSPSSSGSGPRVAAWAPTLERLNIAANRFTTWPQGLACCPRLRELVLGSPLLGRAAEGELERCVRALGALELIEVRGPSLEPRAVRALLAVQRAALEGPGGAGAGGRGRPRVEVTGA